MLHVTGGSAVLDLEEGKVQLSHFCFEGTGVVDVYHLVEIFNFLLER